MLPTKLPHVEFALGIEVLDVTFDATSICVIFRGVWKRLADANILLGIFSICEY